MAKEKSKLKHWEREAKAGAEKIERVEKERDKAKQEAKVARLTTVEAGDVKARANDDLTNALHALAAAEEDGDKLEGEVALPVVE